MAVFESLLQLMIDSGASYVFMWLLFAGLIYGLLMKYEFFEDESVIAGISLGSSFFTLLGIYSFAPPGLFLNFAAAIGFGLFALFGTLIILSITGFDVTELKSDLGENTLAGADAIIVLIAFFGALAYNLNIIDLLSIDTGGDTWENVIFPVIFLIFLLIVLGGATDSGD